MAGSNLEVPSPKKSGALAPSPTLKEAERPPSPPTDNADWHDQIKSASRLFAMAIDCLGLEERHEHLSRSSPLYKKVSSAVLPPFKASYNYIHGPSEREASNQTKKAATPSLAPEDEDVAYPVSEHHGSTSILSMLATASACAGATSLKAIGSILHDRCKDEEELESDTSNKANNRPDLGGGNGKRADLDNDGRELSESDTMSRSSSENIEGKINSNSKSRNASIAGSAVAQSLLHAPKRNSTSKTLTNASSDEAKLMYSSEIMARAFANDEYRPPPENLRSEWENSVMANHHVQSAGDHGLIRYETVEADLTTESPEKIEILKYHIALKLKETFEFDDDNHLYDHFDVWLVKDVLVQGHMFITRDSICFYSLLPGKFSETELNDPELTLHAGALGHKLAHYGESVFSSVYTNRFWAVLKPHTLSIYASPTKLYFPVRTIDLRTAISCEILESGASGFNVASPLDSPHPSSTPTEPSMSQIASEMSSIGEEDLQEENVQSGTWFKINCTDKTYRFHTSSMYSARHWYNSISKAIFSLRNTNVQREVVMRLPIDEIVNYMKNHILTAPEIPDPQVEEIEDTPISFSVEFNSPLNENDSKLHKLKLKSKKLHEKSSVRDSAHFLVFQRGDELSETFEKAMEENVIDSASRHQRAKKKTKKFFREEHVDSMTSHFKKQNHVFSTVQPEHSSSASIINKIVEVNTKIYLAKENEIARLAEDRVDGSQNRVAETDGKMFGYVPIFKGMKEKLLPKTSPLSSISTFGEGIFDGLRKDDMSMPPQDFELPDFEHHLQTPKPFNLQMLKKLDIQMVRRRRGFDDIAGQYGNLSELLKAKRAKDRAFQRFPIQEQNDRKHPETEEQTQNAAASNVKDFNPHSKLNSIKRSLRTVSTMGGVWSAKPEHYDQSFGRNKFYVPSHRDRVKALDHFRNHFSLGPESHLVSTYYAHLKKTVPVYGRLYVGKDQLCFRSLIPGVSTKMVLPLRDIQSCKKQARSYHYAGLVVRIRGLDDLQLSFGSKDARDDCQKVLLKLVRKEDRFNPDSEFVQDDASASSVNIDESERQNAKSDERAMARVHAARLRLLEDKISSATGVDMPLILEDNPFTTTEVTLAKSFKITLLTIGSRGDVQPYIALGKALMKEGHEVTIATHAEFEDWIMKYGIGFKEVAGNPAELMQLMVTHGSISVGFLKEASSKFRGWIGELLESSWKACQGAELLIESPSAMAGLHIAEALNIPYMRAFTMPWTRTRAYPHAFLVPDQNRGGSYNFLTHVMFENVFWKGISGQVNKWRVETLGLQKTSLVKMQQSRVPFLYNVSPAMFPPSVDFPDWVKVTGYWFLDEGSDEYDPPKELVRFLDEARSKKEKIVYIGFGSIVVSDAKALTKTIIDAVVDSGVKCILNKGWSDKLSKSKDDIEVELPSQIYDAGMIPHDWLFTKIDAAVHHGGSGTTGATLRAGLPTIIKPFFGDQFFFASRVEDLGAGIALKHLNKKSFTKALKSVTTEQKYADKATEIAKAMSHERGVYSAIEAIYTELVYSKSLISVVRHNTEQKKHSDEKSGQQTPAINEEDFDLMSRLKNSSGDDHTVNTKA